MILWQDVVACTKHYSYYSSRTSGQLLPLGANHMTKSVVESNQFIFDVAHT